MSTRFLIHLLSTLLLIVPITSCNNDDDNTNNDNPPPAEMLIGTWKPVALEQTERNNPDNKTELSANSMPKLTFYPDGTGQLDATSDMESGNDFTWRINQDWTNDGSYENNNPSVSINGETWYLSKVTESFLIVYTIESNYLFTCTYEPDSIDDNNAPDEDDSTEGGEQEDPSNWEEPIVSEEGGRVSQIIETSYGDQITYLFDYDDQGHIKTFTQQGSFLSEDDLFIYDYEYGYDTEWYGANIVTATGRELGNIYTIVMQNEGLHAENKAKYYITGEIVDAKWDLSFTYDRYERLSYIHNPGQVALKSITYDAWSNLETQGNMHYEYYTQNANIYSIDLNEFTTQYRVGSRNSTYLFTPYGFMGSFGTRLIKKSYSDSGDTKLYKYEVENGKISKIYIYLENRNMMLDRTFSIIYTE